MFGADEVSLSVDKDTKSATGSAAVKARDTDVSSSQKSFRGAVLSAVYSDMREQETRSKNFVVSGLAVDTNVEDKEIVEILCEKELQIKPDIKSCRRLGKNISGKVQPILVSICTKEQASKITSSARKLRKSENTLVRDRVFINPDLTKAQAAAAYELRCKRRQAQVWKTGRHTDSQTSDAQTPLPMLTENSRLRPCAPEFTTAAP